MSTPISGFRKGRTLLLSCSVDSSSHNFGCMVDMYVNAGSAIKPVLNRRASQPTDGIRRQLTPPIFHYRKYLE